MDPTRVDGSYQIRNLPVLGQWDQYTMATFGGDVSDLALVPEQTGPAVYRISSTMNITWGGINRPTNIWPIIFVNVGSYTISLQNEHSPTTANDRFGLPLAGPNFALFPFQPIMVFYDLTVNRWLIMAPASRLTTKGDLLVWNGSTGGPAALSIAGAPDNYVLTTNAAQPTGLAYLPVPASVMNMIGTSPSAGPFTGSAIAVNQANGLRITAGPALDIAVASGSSVGVLSGTAQTIVGAKTFTDPANGSAVTVISGTGVTVTSGGLVCTIKGPGVTWPDGGIAPASLTLPNSSTAIDGVSVKGGASAATAAMLYFDGGLSAFVFDSISGGVYSNPPIFIRNASGFNFAQGASGTDATGNHFLSGFCTQVSSSISWSSITATPTTLAGYGIANGVSTSSAAGGDMSGTFGSLAIANLQGHPLSVSATPTTGYVMTWNGSAWVASALPSSAPTGPAGGDLGGTYPNPSVSKLASYTVTFSVSPTSGQVLTYNGSAWIAQTPSGAPTGAAGGDLGGTYPNPSVGKISGLRLDLPGTPTTGYVLTFNGTSWVASATASTSPSGSAAGDLTGSYPNPTVRQIQGTPVYSAPPSTNDALIFDGSAWGPGVSGSSPTGSAGGDLGGTYPNPSVKKIDGFNVSMAPPPSAGDVLTYSGSLWAGAAPSGGSPTGAAGGDLTGTYPNPGVGKINSSPVVITSPTVGQVLTWNGTAWVNGAVPTPPGSVTLTSAGTYSLDTYVPSGTHTLTLEVIAGGAGGGGGQAALAGGGGGAGAYALQAISYTLGDGGTITVGAGGPGGSSADGTAGADSKVVVSGSTVVLAKGGSPGLVGGSGGTGGAGGLASGSTGSTKFNGGTGAPRSGATGGGGGSSAGPGSAGNVGGAPTGGAAVTGGGAGGNGGTSPTAATAGSAPGGAGGGGFGAGGAGAAGAAGQFRVSWSS